MSARRAKRSALYPASPSPPVEGTSSSRSYQPQPARLRSVGGSSFPRVASHHNWL